MRWRVAVPQDAENLQENISKRNVKYNFISFIESINVYYLAKISMGYLVLLGCCMKHIFQFLGSFGR